MLKYERYPIHMKKGSSNIEENTSHLNHKDQRLILRMVKNDQCLFLQSHTTYNTVRE